MNSHENSSHMQIIKGDNAGHHDMFVVLGPGVMAEDYLNNPKYSKGAPNLPIETVPDQNLNNLNTPSERLGHLSVHHTDTPSPDSKQ